MAAKAMGPYGVPRSYAAATASVDAPRSTTPVVSDEAMPHPVETTTGSHLPTGNLWTGLPSESGRGFDKLNHRISVVEPFDGLRTGLSKPRRLQPGDGSVGGRGFREV